MSYRSLYRLNVGSTNKTVTPNVDGGILCERVSAGGTDLTLAAVTIDHSSGSLPHLLFRSDGVLSAQTPGITNAAGFGLKINTFQFGIGINSNTSGDDFVILSSGNTGIGTNNPQNRLDVEGACVIGASYSGSQTAPTNGLLVEGRAGFGITSGTASLDIYGTTQKIARIQGDPTTGDSSGLFIDAFHRPVANTTFASEIELFMNAFPDTGATITDARSLFIGAGTQGGAGSVTNGYSIYAVAPSYGTNKYTAYLESNVGIGISAPTNNLHVSGASGNAIQIDGATTYGFRMASTTGTPADYLTFDSVNRGTNTVNTANVLVLARNGNVGIGVAQPVNKLDVEGGVAIGASYSGTSTAPSNGMIIEGGVSIGNSVDSSAAYKLEVTSSGNQYRTQYLTGSTNSTSSEWHYGLAIDTNMNGGDGSVNLIGTGIFSNIGASASASNYFGVYITPGTWTAGNSVTNAYSIYADSLDVSNGATNIYGAYIGGRTGIGVANPGVNIHSLESIALTGNVTDGYAASLRINPIYSVSDGGNHTVTRYNYIDLPNVSEVETSGTITITDGAAMAFDAAAGTHVAIDAGTTKSSPGTVDAWLKININGVIYYVPSYTSKTT